jgi:hypothetical protein
MTDEVDDYWKCAKRMTDKAMTFSMESPLRNLAYLGGVFRSPEHRGIVRASTLHWLYFRTD